MTIRHYTSTPRIAVVVAFSVNVLAVVVGFKSLNNATHQQQPEPAHTQSGTSNGRYGVRENHHQPKV